MESCPPFISNFIIDDNKFAKKICFHASAFNFLLCFVCDVTVTSQLLHRNFLKLIDAFITQVPADRLCMDFAL